ncbi:hypothetical protein [Noviherbaspirillum sp.]|uniref:hypothetical protein n=1 Tax=Noviherbaspirillum sp. TaxID=1926288 RepID=UPI002B490FA2|nr:hypothetical protein [Noviherbaspirillum sp.]HJV80756.1 hypothetical protein [Noviherbaspirillum sp.]
MNMKNLGRWVFALVVACLLAACAFNRDVVFHSFSFDVSRDNQDAEVIDFRYGDSKIPVRAAEWAVKEGKTYQTTSYGGRMLRGQFLYVKWRIKSTGNVYEDTVDLRHRLPRDIEHNEVYFMVRGPQLLVYLISPEPRSPGMPAIGPSMYRSRKVTQLYPDERK